MNWNLIISTFKMIVRDKQTLYFSLVFPVLMMVFLKVLFANTMINGVNYIDFVIPGLVGMSVMQLGVFAVAFVVAQQKEKGIIRRLLATPMRASEFLAAQVISRVVISVMQVLLLISVAILVLSFAMNGSFLALIVIGIFGSFVFLALGFVVAGLAKSVEATPVVGNMIIFPMIFFGDIFFSLNNAPKWVQTISDYLPIKYLVDSMREVVVEGSSLIDVKGEILGMAVWLVVLSFIAIKTFSFGTKK
ncbi:MAG: hypothetical protein A3J48_04610 [Candidatus Doudnabacteria bacterium RIFCSPHIGHO2_02_FULL_46_11]|uniref:Transport permease protein n=1 Tax=Candidatus Doudnabacteria bacterium RIFCSPHIGHO2_02_FULL_46_11 TaxID=1817832 RepID=A0A1F5P6K1_9BACT|nr:MAG: hypothetical protein A3J48_04610 [Candidatus Doudnabacteria bacterium RIFCSPHIGHO2_02_FULL_46_11]